MNELQPREKATKYGIASLSDSELIALVLKTGYKKKSVKELSEELLEKTGGIENICALDYEELLNIKGLGAAKASEFMAIVEISKRIASLDKVNEESVHSPDELAKWIRFNIAFNNQEEFFVLYISVRGNIIKSEVLFKGTKSSSLVGIDEIIRRAVLLHADSLVIAHNHPSGNTTPSDADIHLTEKLSKSLALLDLKLLDHIIVSRNSYFSFRQEGLIA